MRAVFEQSPCSSSYMRERESHKSTDRNRETLKQTAIHREKQRDRS